MLSSRSVMVLGLTFRSLIHFELNFASGVNNCPVHSSACGCSVVLTPLIEETVLAPLYGQGSFVASQLAVRVWASPALCPVPLVGMSVFVSLLYRFDYCSFVIIALKLREHNASSFFVLSQNCFCCLGSFSVPHKV